MIPRYSRPAMTAIWSPESRFRIWSQWTPVLLTPVQLAACIGAIRSQVIARKFLPATSGLALLNGTVGFGYHVRGVLRRPGGRNDRHFEYQRFLSRRAPSCC